MRFYACLCGWGSERDHSAMRYIAWEVDNFARVFMRETSITFDLLQLCITQQGRNDDLSSFKATPYMSNDDGGSELPRPAHRRAE